MDTAQPKGRLRAFLKHATIRISSATGHGYANDSASSYSIDDDGRSQRSSKSAKKDSKLRRLGRGIREWRSKRRRLHGDTRSITSQTLEGKSFSSSEGSLAHEPFETDEDLTDEDLTDEDLTDEDLTVEDLTVEDGRVDKPEECALVTSEDVEGEPQEVKVQGAIIHLEIAPRKSPREHSTPRETQNPVQSTKMILSQAPAVLPPSPVYSSLSWPDLPPHKRGQVDVKDLNCLIRLCEQLERWKILRLSEYYCPEKSLTSSTGMRILEQYLGVWVEFQWTQAHCGLRSLHVVLSTKALGPASCDRTVGPIATIQQPAARGPRQLLHLPSVHLAPEVLNMSASPIRGGHGLNHNSGSRPQNQVVPKHIPRPPPALPAPQSKFPTKKRGNKKSAGFKKSLCTHCGSHGHLIRECFEKFPEQKVASPQRYAHYGENRRLERVFPGAFQNLARLHPQLMPQAIHGHDSRYMIGRIGISPHLTPKQCAVWAVRYQEAQPHCDSEDAQSVQDQRRQLKKKYRWDEAQCAQLD